MRGSGFSAQGRSLTFSSEHQCGLPPRIPDWTTLGILALMERAPALGLHLPTIVKTRDEQPSAMEPVEAGCRAP